MLRASHPAPGTGLLGKKPQEQDVFLGGRCEADRFQFLQITIRSGLHHCQAIPARHSILRLIRIRKCSADKKVQQNKDPSEPCQKLFHRCSHSAESTGAVKTTKLIIAISLFRVNDLRHAGSWGNTHPYSHPSSLGSRFLLRTSLTAKRQTWDDTHVWRFFMLNQPGKKLSKGSERCSRPRRRVLPASHDGGGPP